MSELNPSFSTYCDKHRNGEELGSWHQGAAVGKSFLPVSAVACAGGLHPEGICRPNGPSPEAKAAHRHSVVWWGGAEAWAPGRQRPWCAGCALLWPVAEPLAPAFAVQNSLLAAGIVLLYPPLHSLLCTSAKNLPVISKLRQMCRQYYQQSTSTLLSTEATGRALGAGLRSSSPQRHWAVNTFHSVQRELRCQPSGKTLISLLTLCLQFLVWKPESHILALHYSQAVSYITEDVWMLLLMSFGNGLG